jgi:hypothetical protein
MSWEMGVIFTVSSIILMTVVFDFLGKPNKKTTA